MSLKSLIAQLGSDKTASELTTLLNAPSVAIPDNTLYTLKQLTKLLTIAEYRLVSGTIAAAAASDPLVADAQGWLRNGGLDFSDPNSQSLIDALAVAGSWPDSVRDIVKSVGVKHLSPFVHDGGTGVVSETEVQVALDAVRLEALKKQLLEEASQQLNASIAASNDAWNTFVAAVEAWDGSGDPPVMGG